MEEEYEERVSPPESPVPMSTDRTELENSNNRTFDRTSNRLNSEISRRFETFEAFDEHYCDGKIHEIIQNADDVIHSIVLSYMVHYGYKKSAIAFLKQIRESRPQDLVYSSSNSDNNQEQTVQDSDLLYFTPITDLNTNNEEINSSVSSFGYIDERKKIMDLILTNNASTAIDCVKNSFPDLFSKYPTIEFYLNSLVFINLIANGNKIEALQFARQTLLSIVKEKNNNSNNNENKGLMENLKDMSMLLCFPDRDSVPPDSPVAHYLSDEYRSIVAEQVNAAILEMQRRPQDAPLEKILQQLTVARDRLFMESGQRGARWRLNDFLKSSES